MYTNHFSRKTCIVILQKKCVDELTFATHCNTLQHTATHCNTAQDTAPKVSIVSKGMSTRGVCDMLYHIHALYAFTVLQCHALCCSVIHCDVVWCNYKVIQYLISTKVHLVTRLLLTLENVTLYTLLLKRHNLYSLLLNMYCTKWLWKRLIRLQ